MSYTVKKVAVLFEVLDPETREPCGEEEVLTFSGDMVQLYATAPDGSEAEVVTASEAVWQSWKVGDKVGLVINGAPGLYRIRNMEPYTMTIEEE